MTPNLDLGTCARAGQMPPTRRGWRALRPTDTSQTRAFQVGLLPTSHLTRRQRARLPPVLALCPGWSGTTLSRPSPRSPRLLLGLTPCGTGSCGRHIGAREGRSVARRPARGVPRQRGARWGGPSGGAARPGRARGRVCGAGDRGAVEVRRLAAVAERVPPPAVAAAGGILGSLWPPQVAQAAHFAAPPPDTCVPRPRGGKDRWVLRGGGGAPMGCI